MPAPPASASAHLSSRGERASGCDGSGDGVGAPFAPSLPVPLVDEGEEVTHIQVVAWTRANDGLRKVIRQFAVMPGAIVPLSEADFTASIAAALGGRLARP